MHFKHIHTTAEMAAHAVCEDDGRFYVHGPKAQSGHKNPMFDWIDVSVNAHAKTWAIDGKPATQEQVQAKLDAWHAANPKA